MICMNPTTGEPNTPCQPNDIAWLTYSEAQALGGASPFKLDNAAASIISASILLVWATAWGIKQIVLVMRKHDDEKTE